MRYGEHGRINIQIPGATICAGNFLEERFNFDFLFSDRRVIIFQLDFAGVFRACSKMKKSITEISAVGSAPALGVRWTPSMT